MAQTNTPASTKVITGKVRLAFVRVFEPGKNDDGEDVYSVMAFWKKEESESVGVKKFVDAMKNVYEAEKSKKLSRSDGKPIPFEQVKLPVKDADKDVNADGLTLAEQYSEFEGCLYMNLNSKQKPGIVDRDRSPISEEDEKIYSGCYVRLSINFYAYNNRGNKGITAGLNNIQFWDKGEYLGGRASAESDFDALDDAPMDISDEPETGRANLNKKPAVVEEDDVPDWMK